MTPIPRELDPAGAAALMCGGITVYAGLKRAEVKHGQWVVVLGGGGGLGHLAIQYAVALGARVVALDVGAKEEFCLGLGAKAFVDFTKFPDEGQLAAQVMQLTGGMGAKVVLACISNTKTYGQALGLLGFRGTLVCIGVPEGKPEPILGVNVGAMIGNELKMFGKSDLYLRPRETWSGRTCFLLLRRLEQSRETIANSVVSCSCKVRQPRRRQGVPGHCDDGWDQDALRAAAHGWPDQGTFLRCCHEEETLLY